MCDGVVQCRNWLTVLLSSLSQSQLDRLHNEMRSLKKDKLSQCTLCVCTAYSSYPNRTMRACIERWACAQQNVFDGCTTRSTEKYQPSEKTNQSRYILTRTQMRATWAHTNTMWSGCGVSINRCIECCVLLFLTASNLLLFRMTIVNSSEFWALNLTMHLRWWICLLRNNKKNLFYSFPKKADFIYYKIIKFVYCIRFGIF